MFVIRLSASGRGYTRAYLNEAQEVFLDGHVGLFAGLRTGELRRLRWRDIHLARADRDRRQGRQPGTA